MSGQSQAQTMNHNKQFFTHMTPSALYTGGEEGLQGIQRSTRKDRRTGSSLTHTLASSQLTPHGKPTRHTATATLMNGVSGGDTENLYTRTNCQYQTKHEEKSKYFES